MTKRGLEIVARREIPAALLQDSGWRGALAILSSPLFANRSEVWLRVDLQRGSIDFPKMLRVGWSGGERRMLTAAASLFNQDGKVNLYGLVNTLSDTNLRTVIHAIRYSAGMDRTPEDHEQ